MACIAFTLLVSTPGRPRGRRRGLPGPLLPGLAEIQGGKGVATFLGALLAAAWPVGLMACATWLGTALLFRISSLAALVAATLTPCGRWRSGVAMWRSSPFSWLR
jgi:glycerol-3-phosphate acyltransferase PlsY